MKIKVKHKVEIDEDSFQEVLSSYLRNIINETDESEDDCGPGKAVLFAMKVVHDWFSFPSDWYFTAEELEALEAEFKENDNSGDS